MINLHLAVTIIFFMTLYYLFVLKILLPLQVEIKILASNIYELRENVQYFIRTLHNGLILQNISSYS